MSSINGAAEGPKIPDDLVWDEDNPLMVHGCSGSDSTHTPDCDGTCEDVAISKLDVDLFNERLAWARAGMNILNVPTGFDRFGVTGMSLDLFELEAKIGGVINALIESGLLSQDDMDTAYKEWQLNKLTIVRELNEGAIKEARSRAMLGIRQKPGLLGPNGERLG